MTEDEAVQLLVFGGPDIVGLSKRLGDLVAQVRAANGDHEAAHAREDELRVVALRAIASGHFSEAACAFIARVALTTVDDDFPRHCS